ncbi:Rhodanese-like domain-containing protein [Scheffersomyces coipomensis]|uniref:Rhodanese-like domain-containing protein n=1 Tax=Scheffersomyces coipomensis TaxID=1788519 RepID=UPI00315C4EB9
MSIGLRSFKQAASSNYKSLLIRNLSSSTTRSFFFPSSSTSLSSVSSAYRAVNKSSSLLSNNLRFYSIITNDPSAKLYQYEDIKAIATNPETFKDSVLIDVREPFEFNDGHIPGALNIPFKSSPGALDLSVDEFQDNFGFDKPSQDKELVFYCLGGVRSTAAEELACTFGYKKRGNYVGSWEDWIAHENSAATPSTSTSSSSASTTSV